MHTTLPHLQSSIRTALQKGQVCRIYNDSLIACWPNIPDAARMQKIENFATQNRWTVAFRELPGLGQVAEFHHPDFATVA